MYLALKYKLRTLFFCLPLEMEPPFYMAIWATQRSSLFAVQRAGKPSFLSYFKTMSIGAAPWMQSTTSCSAVKCSNDWANPATVKKHVVSLLNHHNNKCGVPYLVQYRLCGKYIVEAFEWHTLFDKKKYWYTWNNMSFVTLEMRKELGRVIIFKDFWDCYKGHVQNIGQQLTSVSPIMIADFDSSSLLFVKWWKDLVLCYGIA